MHAQHSSDLHDWLSAGAHRFRGRDLLWDERDGSRSGPATCPRGG